MKHIVTPILLGVLTLACLLAGRGALLMLVAGLATVGAGELFRLARARGVRPSPLVGLSGIFALLFVAHVRGEKAPPFFPAVLAGALGLCFVAMIGRRRRAEVARAIAYTLLPVVWVGILAAYLLALRGTAGGFRLVLTLVAMAVASETGTWLAARIEHESLPGIVSRALLGGLIASVVVAVVAALAVPETFSWGTALVLAVLVTVSARAGKMAGAMIEHDGGNGAARVLRRIDGVLFSAPVFFYGFRVLAR